MICPICNEHAAPWVRRTLAAGERVEIFLKTDSGDLISDGYATLMERTESWRIPEPYPIVLHCKKCKKQCNALDERWLVKYDDGFVTARWIPKLTKQGTIHVSDELDQISDDEEEDLLG